MNIGVDIDGTLTDIGIYQIETGKRYFRREPADSSAFDIEQIFACSAEERKQYWKKYIWAYCLSFPPYPDAAAVIRKLRRQGHRIIIITSRVYTAEHSFMGMLFRRMLLYWLKKNGIQYDDIVFCRDDSDGSEKQKACEEKRIDVMIDDKPENLAAIVSRMKVICYPAPWNQTLHEPNLIHVSDWKNICKVIHGGK